MKDVRIWVKDAGLLLKAEKTVIIEGGRRRPWPSGKWYYHLCGMEESAHWKQFHWKSCIALWDNWICGGLSEEPKCCSSIFTCNDFDYFSTKTSVMWGFASLAMKKKKRFLPVWRRKSPLCRWAIISIWAVKFQQWFPQQERAAGICPPDLLHMVTYWNWERNYKLPFSREESAPTSTRRREHKGCVGLFMKVTQQTSAAEAVLFLWGPFLPCSLRVQRGYYCICMKAEICSCSNIHEDRMA